MSESLITQESSKLIEEVRSFLETVVEVKISNETEKKNVVTLGNELQKKFSTIEKARKAEKGIWDAKAKAVQDEFKPVLDLLTAKKNILGSAVTAYDRQLEAERRQRQIELDNAAQRERDALEKLAGTREERRQMYQKKLDEANSALPSLKDDLAAYNTMIRQIRHYQAKVEEFTEKAAETFQQAAQVVAPTYQPEAPTANKGTRKTMEASFTVIDKAAAVKWCLECGELHLLDLNTAKINTRIKETEGQIVIHGLDCRYTEKTGFSGR